MTVATEHIELPAHGPGATHRLLKHTFSCEGAQRSAYIQAGLHADEHPGLLVIQHLLGSLVRLEAAGRLRGRIVVIPFANPVGLGQRIFGAHAGRFNLDNGENFNRRFPALADDVRQELASRTIERNDTKTVKQLFSDIAGSLKLADPVTTMKANLLGEALRHDIVLDLHCDTSSVLHLYSTINQQARAVSLARHMHIHAVFLEDLAGGLPFDEAYAQPWRVVQQAGLVDERHTGFCASIELRGQADVSDELAQADAQGILRYLAHEGLVELEGDAAYRAMLGEGEVDVYPLEGVSHVPSPATGLVVYKKQLGDTVEKGEAIAEIVPIDGALGAARHIVRSDVDGIFVVQQQMKLLRTGQRVALLAGKQPLPHRKAGQLLNDF